MPQPARILTHADAKFIEANFEHMTQNQLCQTLHISLPKLLEKLEELRQQGYKIPYKKMRTAKDAPANMPPPVGHRKEYPDTKEIQLKRLRAAAARL